MYEHFAFDLAFNLIALKGFILCFFFGNFPIMLALGFLNLLEGDCWCSG